MQEESKDSSNSITLSINDNQCKCSLEDYMQFLNGDITLAVFLCRNIAGFTEEDCEDSMKHTYLDFAKNFEDLKNSFSFLFPQHKRNGDSMHIIFSQKNLNKFQSLLQRKSKTYKNIKSNMKKMASLCENIKAAIKHIDSSLGMIFHPNELYTQKIYDKGAIKMYKKWYKSYQPKYDPDNSPQMGVIGLGKQNPIDIDNDGFRIPQKRTPKHGYKQGIQPQLSISQMATEEDIQGSSIQNPTVIKGNDGFLIPQSKNSDKKQNNQGNERI